MDPTGKLVMECILETKASTILEFFAGLRGSLSVAFEEGTSATWLYDLLKPHVARVVVCNPRKTALLKHGNKNDRIDAGKLANLSAKTTSGGRKMPQNSTQQRIPRQSWSVSHQHRRGMRTAREMTSREPAPWPCSKVNQARRNDGIIAPWLTM
jgi:hypothetical protein